MIVDLDLIRGFRGLAVGLARFDYLILQATGRGFDTFLLRVRHQKIFAGLDVLFSGFFLLRFHLRHHLCAKISQDLLLLGFGQLRLAGQRIRDSRRQRLAINIDFLAFEIRANIHADGIAGLLLGVFKFHFFLCDGGSSQQ